MRYPFANPIKAAGILRTILTVGPEDLSLVAFATSLLGPRAPRHEVEAVLDVCAPLSNGDALHRVPLGLESGQVDVECFLDLVLIAGPARFARDYTLWAERVKAVAFFLYESTATVAAGVDPDPDPDPLTPMSDYDNDTLERKPNSIQPDDIAALMDGATFDQTKLGEKTTVVLATLENGFAILGSSSCVDPANYDHELGVELAKKKIVDQLWQLEGYRLQCALDLTPGVVSEAT